MHKLPRLEVNYKLIFDHLHMLRVEASLNIDKLGCKVATINKGHS